MTVNVILMRMPFNLSLHIHFPKTNSIFFSNSLPRSHVITLLESKLSKNTRVLHVADNQSSPWIVDFGASNHMTCDKSLFSSFLSSNHHQTVRITDGTHTKLAGPGDVKLSNLITLYSVLFVPNLDCNLIFVSKLYNDLNCETKFSTDCVFQDLNMDRMIGSARLCDGHYLLDVLRTLFFNNESVSFF